jgi:L-2-hydroxyglutarate oxidase LhgO
VSSDTPIDIAPIDLAIAGGGLAGALIALALRARRPELRVVVIESGDSAGAVITSGPASKTTSRSPTAG